MITAMLCCMVGESLNHLRRIYLLSCVGKVMKYLGSSSTKNQMEVVFDFQSVNCFYQNISS